jgi:hypothetical protein
VENRAKPLRLAMVWCLLFVIICNFSLKKNNDAR